jgi:hypothetical protein
MNDGERLSYFVFEKKNLMEQIVQLRCTYVLILKL